MMATVESLLTAEDYAALPAPGFLSELVDGEIIRVNMPRFHHGVLRRRVASIIGDDVDRHDLGWV